MLMKHCSSSCLEQHELILQELFLDHPEVDNAVQLLLAQPLIELSEAALLSMGNSLGRYVTYYMF